MVQYFTSMEQFNQICWMKTMESNTTKYNGAKNCRIFQNTTQNISIHKILQLLIPFTVN